MHSARGILRLRLQALFSRIHVDTQFFAVLTLEDLKLVKVHANRLFAHTEEPAHIDYGKGQLTLIDDQIGNLTEIFVIYAVNARTLQFVDVIFCASTISTSA